MYHPQMRCVGVFILGCLLFSVPFIATGSTPEAAIQKVLEQQVLAWNRGDLTEFVASYAGQCTLVGSTISETTRAQVLAHYQQKYPSSSTRGKLAFSGLTVHSLDARVATVTGNWHFDREASSGGPVGGVFSLVFESLNGHWEIVLDHTS